MVETFAAVLAATDDFTGAASTWAKVIDAAPEEKRPDLRERLTLYQTNRAVNQ